MQFQRNVARFIIVKRLYLYDMAITTRLREKARYLVPSSHSNADEKEDQIDLLQGIGIDPAEITYNDSFASYPDLGGYFSNAHFFVTQEVMIVPNRNLKI